MKTSTTHTKKIYNNSLTELNDRIKQHLASRGGNIDRESDFEKQLKAAINSSSRMSTARAPSDAGSIGGGSKSNMTLLPSNFVPGEHDVLCGRGKKNYNSLGTLQRLVRKKSSQVVVCGVHHLCTPICDAAVIHTHFYFQFFCITGNQRLRIIVDAFVERYANSTSRQDKSDILSTIVNTVRGNSPYGGFVKEDTTTGRWYEVGDFLAREKVSQAFRDALSHAYRSSKKYKHEKRRMRDKAAKAAKALKEGKPVPASKPAKKKAAPKHPSSPLQQRGRLSVLREESASAPVCMQFVPSGQGNTPPNGSSGVMMPGTDAVSDNTRVNQEERNLYLGDPPAGSQQQQVGYNNFSGVPSFFPQANPMMYNQFYGAGMNTQSGMTMGQHRRHSEFMMRGLNNTNAMNMGGHPYHNSNTNLNWSPQMEFQGGMQGMQSFHSSFPSGVNYQGGEMMAMGMGNMNRGMAGMMQTDANNMMNIPNLQGGIPRQRSRSMPLQRSVSTSSATGIISGLELALPEFSHHHHDDDDENPFEPVPLPSEEAGRDPSDGVEDEHRERDTAHTPW